jgi:hypothetical protein
MHIGFGEIRGRVGILEGRTQGNNGEQEGAVYRQPGTEAQWTHRVTRLSEVALTESGKHATFNSTFWQDANIFGDLHSIKLSYKYIPLYYSLKTWF